MAFTSISPSRERMHCESGTVSPTGPGDSREGAAGHYVAASRLAPAFFYRNAWNPQHDRWELDGPHPDPSRSRLYFSHKSFPTGTATDDLLPYEGWEKSLYQLH